MMNSNISLNDIIFNNDIKSLRNINNKFLNNLSSNSGICTIETVNLLQQANKTIINVNKLLKDNEIVDSATLMRSCIEKIAMAMMIYFDPTKTYEEFKKLKNCGKTENTKPGNLVKEFSKYDFDNAVNAIKDEKRITIKYTAEYKGEKASITRSLNLKR